MRTIDLNGYIDDEVFWGDEITPDMLRSELYGTSGSEPDDLRITLNSFGGSCVAATRMYDMLKDYPGKVHVVISGVAASAASVLALAGDRVEMTPGSLAMIHNPSCLAWGEERDLEAAQNLLHATKESIINIYARKTDLGRKELSKMMDATTWLDASDALAKGFIDGITGDATQQDDVLLEDVPSDQSTAMLALKPAACIDCDAAAAKVRAWIERQMPGNRRGSPPTTAPEPAPTPAPLPEPNNTPAPAQPAGVSHADLDKRLSLLLH